MLVFLASAFVFKNLTLHDVMVLAYDSTLFALAFAAALAAGFLAKASELNRFPSRARIAFGFACGFLLAFAAGLSVETGVLFYGIAVGLLVAGKIDAPPHYAAFVGGLVGVLAFGIPVTRTQLPLVGVTALTVFFDEKTHDFATKKIKRRPKQLKQVLFKQVFSSVFGFAARNRLFLEFFAITLTVFAGTVLLLAALLAFDAGYAVAVRLQSNKKEKKLKRKKG